MKLRETIRWWYQRHPRASTVIVLCLWLATFFTSFWSIWAALPGLAVCILVTVLFRGVIPAIRPRALFEPEPQSSDRERSQTVERSRRHDREVKVKKKPKEKKNIKLVN